MERQFFAVPVNGAMVPDPRPGFPRFLSECGSHVSEDAYWRRRENEGVITRAQESNRNPMPEVK